MKRLLCALALSCATAGVAINASAFFLSTRAITSVFDTTRNSTGNAVFSNGNATVTAGPSTAAQLSAFTNVFHAAGKFAFRVTENICTTPGTQGCAIGLGAVGAPDNTYLGKNPATVGIFDSGQIRVGDVILGTGPGFSPGNTIDVEVDFDGKTISYSVNGGAFSTPVSIASLTNFLLSPAVTMNAATDAFTYNGNVSFPGFPAWNSAPSPPVTMTVSLSSTTFTSGVANSTVGTVAVTNSSGPASSATLSLTGANTGGFHLSGTTPGSSLLTAGGSGTAAGTYTDVNIVATQAGISNSPQQISPSLVGSAGGAVPQPAQVAGFTTQVINDNFQTLGPPSGWYDCAMSGGTPLYWRAWVGFGTNIDAPCNAVTVEADPGGGGQTALKMHWQDSYYPGDTGSAHTTVIQTADNSGNGRSTPPGFYLEVVARTDLATGGPPKAWMALWSLTKLTGNNSYEIDGFEESGQGGGFAIHNNIGIPGSCADVSASPPCAGASIDVTQYHTYAWRQTSAGTDIVFCAYVGNADGTGMVKYGCNGISPNSTQLASGANFVMAHQFGIDQQGTNPTLLGNGSTGKNTWIRSIKVWSCDTFTSGNLCHSSSDNP